MKKQEIVNYFKTYNKSAKISVLADLLEHNVISAEMLNSAQRIVLNRRTRKKLIKEITESKKVTSYLFEEVFNINSSDFRYIFNTESLVVNRSELSIIVDELQLHLYQTIFENEKALEKLVSYIAVYNDYIKENKVPGKTLFYNVKNKVLKELVSCGFLRRWTVERKDVNESYYAFKFEINGKVFYFHQPTAYKEYADILLDDFKIDERDYSRDKVAETNIVLNDDLVSKLQTLWRFISRKNII